MILRHPSPSFLSILLPFLLRRARDTGAASRLLTAPFSILPGHISIISFQLYHHSSMVWRGFVSLYGTLHHPSQLQQYPFFSAMPALFYMLATSSIFLRHASAQCSAALLHSFQTLLASFCGAGEVMPSSYRRIPCFHGTLQHQAGLLRCTFFLALLASFCDAVETGSFPTARSIPFPGCTTTSSILPRQHRAVSWRTSFCSHGTLQYTAGLHYHPSFPYSPA